MGIRSRLKKAVKHPAASALLASALVAGGLAYKNHTQNTTEKQGQTEFVLSTFSGMNMFDISGSEIEKHQLESAISEIYNTAEGRKLLEDLCAYDKKIEILLNDTWTEEDQGSTDQKKDGFPVQLNKELLKDPLGLSETLFHELCHVRQYRDVVGRINDTQEERYDYAFATELEARIQSALMTKDLLARGFEPRSLGGEEWFAQASTVDYQVYAAIKDGLSSSKEGKNLSEEEIEKRSMEELCKAMSSGKIGDLIKKFVSQELSEQFQKINSKWFYSYSLISGAHAIDFPYLTMQNSESAMEGVKKIAQRLNVDLDVLLPITGIDLVDVQKDDAGNIISGTRISRLTGENMGIFQCAYDKQNRPLSMSVYENGKLRREISYEYGEGFLPIKSIDRDLKYERQDSIDYDNEGQKLFKLSESKYGTDKTWYKNNKPYKSIGTTQYSYEESTYGEDGYEVIDRVLRTNTGDIISEYHKPKSTEQQSINSAVLLKAQSESQK